MGSLTAALMRRMCAERWCDARLAGGPCWGGVMWRAARPSAHRAVPPGWQLQSTIPGFRAELKQCSITTFKGGEPYELLLIP